MLSRYFFFFNDTATTEIYTLSLHDALPISGVMVAGATDVVSRAGAGLVVTPRVGLPLGDALAEGLDGALPEGPDEGPPRSEEHTSELQSRQYLVCRLLLEKKKVT